MLANITVLENEDEGAFHSLLETLKRTHRPQDETEHIHVETISFRNMAGSATPAELILRYEAHGTASLFDPWNCPLARLNDDHM